MEKITAGEIIAKFVVDLKSWDSSLKKATTKLKTFVKGITSISGKIGEGMDKFGGRMVEQAERFTFLAGAILGPITLSMKSFADKSDEAKQKYIEISKEIESRGPKSVLEFLKMNRQQKIQYDLLQRQRIEYRRVASETAAAKTTQDMLVEALKSLNTEFGKLLWETLLPYVNQITKGVIIFRLWIDSHSELTKKIMLVVAGFGALMAVIAPTFAIVGKVIRVFGALFTLLSTHPFFVIIAALTAVYLMLKDKIDPILIKIWEYLKPILVDVGNWLLEVGKTAMEFWQPKIDALTDSVVKLWDAWKAGDITLASVTEAIKQKLTDFITNVWNWAFEKMESIASDTWNSITGIFSSAVDQINSFFYRLNHMFDSAVGHSWWTDSLKKMHNTSADYLGKTAGVFSLRSSQIVGAMNVIQSASKSVGRTYIPRSALSGMVASGGGSSNTINIGVNGGDLARELKPVVYNTVRGYVRRTIRTAS